MEGITIINTIPIYATDNDWMRKVAVGCFLAVFVMIFLASIFKDYATVFIIISMVLAIMTAVFIMIYSLSDNTNTDVIEKYQYEVLIEDSVRFDDFNDKYEVVDRRGEIYTIEEK